MSCNILQNVTDFLKSRGHELNREEVTGFSVVMAVARDEKSGKIYANSDFRKAGGVDGF